MSARRFRWLPRFSIGNLLMLMVIVGLCLAWYDQRRKLGELADVIEKQRLELTRLTVNDIVARDLTEVEKMSQLARFVKLGDRFDDVAKWCGERLPTSNLHVAVFAECDLILKYDGQGLIRHIACYKGRQRTGRTAWTYEELATE
jgi:hypothetical protein